ncbi:putative ABC transport system permease protein [Parabacteroides sp. PF5-5]|uniref:ABC transporter permease n=1 Tax=unclassified Parabacteroides TaxID=2649774 RepID=UPI002473C6B7|nr:MULTISPECIES: FtsX-like permease family protein [unclassified Parabacteroides]MDH6305275.1 putative ABC transport system permease protein [Parabacteroides sp. PH5-39]MDH6316628.1 putative ABC transport system permease protein [Parabacteroides sp. PF5-13]MDH6320192.1 putative ABC transport system permease protein [Parabacteroides sp. PH5-13]MDH6323865.1 putative ABC transport system permease protein [Parabacteroides sp. PH5-8]MDH6327869.1 putative ABC transport system permease protein [Parab
MIKQLFKQIWVERKQNAWLLIELAVVFFFLLLMTDFLWVKLKNYMEPKGFNIENTYMMKLKMLEPIAQHYVNPEEITQTSVEDLFTIVERIKLHPDVEVASVSLFSEPYSMGGFWIGLRADSIQTPSVRNRMVTPSYFDVFQIRTPDGKPIQVQETGYSQLVLTEDIGELLFGEADRAIGQEVFFEGFEGEIPQPNKIAQVCNLLKRQDFYPYEGAYFEMLSTSKYEEWVKNNDITWTNICLRIRPGSARHFEEHFISEMGDRLRENNLYVASIVSSDKLRDDVVGKMIREDVLPMTYVMIFVLITVFMGVFGAFWLRTRQRRAEIGIRMAMGANNTVVWRSILVESLCLVSLIIIPAFLVYLNMLNADILDTWRLPFTAGRTLIALGSALLIMCVIVISGTFWPANRAASIQPIDALRDE